MFEIGASVSTPQFGSGFVVGIGGAPGGKRSYRVAKPGPGHPLALDVPSDQVEPGPELPQYEVGQSVHVHAGQGVVLAREADRYAVLVTRPRRSGVVLTHLYPAVRPHEIALG